MKKITTLIILCIMSATIFAGCGVKEESNDNGSEKKGSNAETNVDKPKDEEQKESESKSELTDGEISEEDKIMFDTIKASVVAAFVNEDARSEMIEAKSGSFDLTTSDAISIPELKNFEFEIKESFGEGLTPPKTAGMTKYHVEWEMNEDNSFPVVSVEVQP